MVANLKLEVFDSGLGRFERTLVATAGDRICLSRTLWSGGPADGRVEIEFLSLAEVDESGHFVGAVIFGVDDRRAAQREGLSRWIARDAVAAAVMGPIVELIEGLNDHDRARMRAVLTDDLVVQDRRRLTGEDRVDGADAYLDNVAVLWDLAPDAHLEGRSVLALEHHGSVSVVRTLGTNSEGGAFELYYLIVTTVARGRVTRLERFELDAADAALARLAELRPDPLRIPPNAATRASDRWGEAVAAGDIGSVEALFAATLVFEDRRRGILTSGGREMLVANDRLLTSSKPHWSRTVLATAGDRLALWRSLVSGTYEGAAFEVEFLQVIEVDRDDRLVANIVFDPDDRRAASRELLERWEKSDAAHGLRLAARRAVLDRDLDRLRAELPDDFVFHDYRHSGVGRLEGIDAYLAWTASLLEASPDAILEPLYHVATAPHASLTVAHTFGTLADGGAFESVFVALSGPGFTEVYELDDLERARARFEELRPDPSLIPANAASRARDRSFEAWQARDWDALRALASPDFSFEDRSKRALVSGGVETWIENNRFMPPGVGRA